ncbi:unnamed protein product, partial [Ectocarpus sp. 12 AP-2014]
VVVRLLLPPPAAARSLVHRTLSSRRQQCRLLRSSFRLRSHVLSPILPVDGWVRVLPSGRGSWLRSPLPPCRPEGVVLPGAFRTRQVPAHPRRIVLLPIAALEAIATTTYAAAAS